MTGVHSIDATGLLTPFASSTRRWTINNASLAKTNVKVKVKMGPKRSESIPASIPASKQRETV
jgi:hypothetical protein